MILNYYAIIDVIKVSDTESLASGGFVEM